MSVNRGKLLIYVTSEYLSKKRSNLLKMFQFLKKGGSRQEALVDRLLFSALIEARSCERFRVLSENLKDPELAQFYRELMESEAGHYTLFIGHARNYGGREQADKRWREWLDYEETVIKNYGNKQSIHG